MSRRAYAWLAWLWLAAGFAVYVALAVVGPN